MESHIVPRRIERDEKNTRGNAGIDAPAFFILDMWNCGGSVYLPGLSAGNRGDGSSFLYRPWGQSAGVIFPGMILPRNLVCGLNTKDGNCFSPRTPLADFHAGWA